MKKILLVGAGAWGKNYINTLSLFSDVKLEVANRNTWHQLIDNKPDGVIVATPPDSHIEIAKFALERDIPTMIEKPLALSVADAKQLLPYSHIPILVNHIHLFSDAYQRIKSIVQDKQITKIITFGHSSNGWVRDYSALWDYGPHDLSLILDLIGEYPIGIKIEGDPNRISFIKMLFKRSETSSVVGVEFNGQKNKRNIWIDLDGVEIYYDDKKRSVYHTPPLTNALQVFIKSIDGYEDDRLGLNLSFDVLKILEQCDKLLLKSN